MSYDNLSEALSDNADQTFRARQRVCAFHLGLQQQQLFTNKALRELCKEHGAFNSPNFTRNLKQEPEHFFGSSKAGWQLTPLAKTKAITMFGATDVSADEPSTDDPIDESTPEPTETGVSAESAQALPEPEDLTPDSATEGAVVKTAIIVPTFSTDQAVGTLNAPKPEPKDKTTVIVPPRPPRVRGSDMLAAMFHKIEGESE